MFTIFSYLACAAFIMLIIGLIKPKWGSFGRYPDINRWKLALLWFAVVAVFSSVGSAFMTDADKITFGAEETGEAGSRARQKRR